MQHPVHVRLAVRTALTLQHLAHVRLTVRAGNHITPPVNPTHSEKLGHRSTSLDQHQLPATIVQLHFYDSTDINYTQQSSSCTSSTHPTSATSNDCLAASLRLDHTSYQHHPSSWRHKYNYHELYALINTIINCHLCYICYLAFVSFIVFGCH